MTTITDTSVWVKSCFQTVFVNKAGELLTGQLNFSGTDLDRLDQLGSVLRCQFGVTEWQQSTSR